MFHQSPRMLSAAAFLLAAPLAASADTINIAMHNGATTANGFNAPRGDGLVVSTGTNGSDTWNNPYNNGAGGQGLNFSGFALLLDDGNPSGASLAANAGFTSFNNNGWGNQNDDYVMMEGWYGFLGSESLTVSGLGSAFTSGGYTVTIYGDLNQARTMNYTIGGTTKTINTTAATFNGTFSEGDNFVTFTGLSGSSFTVTGNAATTRSAINGLVIQAVPEPSSLALLGLAGLGFARRRRG